MRQLCHQFYRIFLTVAVCVALVSTGFAHRVGAADADDRLLAYVAAGGALDDLCHDSGSHHMGGGPCDACRLVDGAIVPGPAVAPAARLVAWQQPRVLSATAGVSGVTKNPACPVRAPPRHVI